MFMGRPLLLQSCCVPAEGAAAGSGLFLEFAQGSCSDAFRFF